MRKIILTGSTGFVGENLLLHFEKTNSAAFLKLDLRTKLPNSLPPSNAIIHLAGKAHDLKNTSDQQAYFDINYSLTKDLFDLFLQSEIKDFIFFSSVKAVADTVNEPLHEDTFPKPKTAYGLSKLLAEQYLLSKKLPNGKRLFIFRPCMIHGPGNKGNLNLLYKAVKKGTPYPFGSFENNRSFLSIDNLLYIIEKTLNDPSIPGGIYNLADDDPLSTIQIYKIISNVLKSKARVWKIPKKIMKKLAKIGDTLHLSFNSDRLTKLTENYIVSNAKIKHALKIGRLPVSSEQGLFQTIKSFE